MSVFSDAVAALHADPDLSVACTWTAGPEQDPAGPVAFRGVQSQPLEPAFGGGSLGAVTPRRWLDVAVADLPAAPARGDAVTIEGEAFAVETAELDPEGVTWRLTLSDAP